MDLSSENKDLSSAVQALGGILDRRYLRSN